MIPQFLKPVGDGYYISEYGKLWSSKTKKFLIGFTNGTSRYLYCRIFGNRVPIHRLVAEHWLPPKPKGCDQINHIDGNKYNNHYSNLEWCDATHNNRHRSILQKESVKKYKLGGGH